VELPRRGALRAERRDALPLRAPDKRFK
jgi:hypothetical protein